MVKIDLHTHSIASPDGALNVDHYRHMLEKGRLDCIAVTDHNTIERAVYIQKKLGADKIIVGEEITTTQGELIGLFLEEAVPPQLTPEETVKRIHKQGGLVYVPHPFETVRKGVTLKTLNSIAAGVDIVEIYNGRAIFQDKCVAAIEWAGKHSMPGAAASDSHGYSGWGRTYTLLAKLPERDSILDLLRKAKYQRAFPGLVAILYPKVNRLRKNMRRHD